MGPEERQLAAEGSSCFSQCEKHRHLWHSFVSLTQKQKTCGPRRPKHNGTVATTVDGRNPTRVAYLVKNTTVCIPGGCLGISEPSTAISMTIWKSVRLIIGSSKNQTGSRVPATQNNIRPMRFSGSKPRDYKDTPQKTAKFSSWKLSHRIQICPKKGISPIILFWRWDVSTINPTLGRGSGFLGCHGTVGLR